MRIYRLRRFPSKLVLFVLTALIIFLVPSLRDNFKKFAFDILAKPIDLVTGIKGYVVRVKELSEENLLLKQRLAMQSVTLARMRDMSLENERLHLLLDFEKNLTYNSYIAKVIGRDSLDWRNSLIINKGKRHSIRLHMPCATSQGVVGSVAEVSNNSSKVMLITDPNSRIGVVLETARESGVLVGSSEGNCKVIYLSLDCDIKRGDSVLTAGFSAFFPNGLVVGKVTDVAIEKNRLYKYAVVEPSVPMNRIEEVVCIDIEK